MGEPNNALRVYMGRPDRIRSVLEYCLGEKLPQDWSCYRKDGFLPARDKKGKLTFRERDYLGEARAWGIRFLLGIENQETLNLTYPWRLMEMDCLTYGDEIREIQERNDVAGVNHEAVGTKYDKAGKNDGASRTKYETVGMDYNAAEAKYGTVGAKNDPTVAKQAKGRTKYGAEDDFKYRYRKEDRLKPIVNIMLYWGRKPWKGPLSLQGMMSGQEALPEKFRRMVGDYPVYMVAMRSISDADLQKMDSDLRYVLGIMKCTSSAKRYMQFILENREYFSKIPRSAVDVIDALTNIKDVTSRLQYTLNEKSDEEEADMCKAWEDIKRQEKEEGIRQGVKQGERSGTLKTLYSLVNDGLLKLEDAAARAGLSQETFRRKMRKAGYR